MSRGFAEIAFSSTVQDFQTQQGSRKAYAKWENHEPERDAIGPLEQEFIEGRDGFYQASVNPDGWPYVQYRGGPLGFLRVLDDKSLAYADFRGNVQYVSAGNIKDSEKISIILMDYANRRRLKLFARARLVEWDEDPDLIESLQDPAYNAKVERAVVLNVEALNWNCPQHITPRYTQGEIEEQVRPLLEKMQAELLAEV